MTPGSQHQTVSLAVISAITSIVVAGITAFGVTQKSLGTSSSQIENLATKASSIQTALSAAGTHVCPAPITKQNFEKIDVYSSHGGSQDDLVTITGSGCLIGGSVLGYYFAEGSANYTIRLSIDGVAHQFPPKDRHGNDVAAYAQDVAGQNTGVLTIPPVRFEESLQITVTRGPNSTQEISAYA